MSHESRRDFVAVSGLGLLGWSMGCRSEGAEVLKAGDASGRGGHPAPAKDGTTTAALRPFRLDVVSAGGRVMARAGGVEVREWSSWLRVRSDDARADLVITRHNGDLVDRPVGWFRDRLEADALARLQQAIDAIPWDELPPPQTTDVTANLLRIDYTDASRAVQRELSTSDGALLTAIAPLLEQLFAAMAAPLAHPKAAVAVAAEAGAKGKPLRLRLRNAGTEPVVLTDPRVPAAAGEDPRARLMVAAAPGPMDMPSFTAIALPALPAGAPTVRRLAAGEALVIEVPWQPTLHGACVLQAIWSDYAGVEGERAGALPFMPEATDPPSAAAGPYAVRGATFSSYASFDA